MNDRLMQPHFLVSTDLDGTLLDHYSYDWQAAAPSLARLAKLGIPVVINTSKTFEEVVSLQSSMLLTAPFIVENGSALFLPTSQFEQAPDGCESNNGFWRLLIGCERQAVTTALSKIRQDQHWQFEGFSDMSVARVIELTGLTESDAQQALNRRFSEPLVWHDTDANFVDFVKQLEALQFRVIKGGRFVHVLGQTDKGKAIDRCRRYLQHFYSTELNLIALGDSPNDIDMLNIADIAVLINSPTHDYPALPKAVGEVYQTQGLGPVGWHEAITKFIP